VKNLPLGITEAQLSLLFSRFGAVRSLRIKKPNGVDARNVFTTAYAIAYVNFENEEDAKKAIIDMNGKTHLGHVLQIEFYDKSQQQHVYAGASDITQFENLKGLYINRINKSVSIIIEIRHLALAKCLVWCTKAYHMK